MSKPISAVCLCLAGALSGCGYDFNGPMCGPSPAQSFVFASRTTAQFPRAFGGSEAYQDHAGPDVPVMSAPALNDTGSERMPVFNGQRTQVQTAPDFVIMPNGGERPVESLNSLPSAPCMAMLGNG